MICGSNAHANCYQSASPVLICGCLEATCSDANHCRSASPKLDSQELLTLLSDISSAAFWTCFRKLRGVDPISVNEAAQVSARAADAENDLQERHLDLLEMRDSLCNQVRLNVDSLAINQLESVEALLEHVTRQMHALRSVQLATLEMATEQRGQQVLVAMASAVIAVHVVHTSVPICASECLEFFRRVLFSFGSVGDSTESDVIAMLIGNHKCLAVQRKCSEEGCTARQLLVFALEAAGQLTQPAFRVTVGTADSMNMQDWSDQLARLPDSLAHNVAHNLALRHLRELLLLSRLHPFSLACRSTLLTKSAAVAAVTHEAKRQQLQMLWQLMEHLQGEWLDEPEADMLLQECGEAFNKTTAVPTTRGLGEGNVNGTQN